VVSKDEEYAMQQDNKWFMDAEPKESEKMAVIMLYVALIAIVALVTMWVVTNGK